MIVGRGPRSGFRKTIVVRRNLRRQITPTEKLFWYKVSGKQFYNYKFRRQHGIGKYIVDFYCPAKKLIIEIDGDTHATPQAQVPDRIRTKYLESLGYQLIRYQNRDIINNIEGVFEDLHRRLKSL